MIDLGARTPSRTQPACCSRVVGSLKDSGQRKNKAAADANSCNSLSFWRMRPLSGGTIEGLILNKTVKIRRACPWGGQVLVDTDLHLRCNGLA